MSVLEDLRRLVRKALQQADGEHRPTLETLDGLFDEPLRVAFVGMVKAGKSTLLNALVGQRVAPTDFGECTRIVTLYERGRHYAVTAIGEDESRSELQFERGEQLVVHLGEKHPEDIDHIEVRWPSDRLLDRQLIDTPGLGSLSADVSARSEQFLTANDEMPADVVVYLSRHRHPADLRFLESFHGGMGGAGPMSAITVLSRADELAGGRIDALRIAADVAESMAADPRVRRVAQTVIPVAGLLAETAATLRQHEFDTIAAIAGEADDAVASALLTADRFVAADLASTSSASRAELLERLGLFGVRLAINLVVKRPDTSAASLAEELSARSGIGELQNALRTRFDERRLALRSRTVLSTLGRMDLFSADSELATEMERILSNAHEVVELDALDAIRLLPDDALATDDAVRLERTLGYLGAEPSVRLELGASAAHSDVVAAAGAELAHWQAMAAHPLSSPAVRHLSSIAVRSCEAMIAAS